MKTTIEGAVKAYADWKKRPEERSILTLSTRKDSEWVYATSAEFEEFLKLCTAEDFPEMVECRHTYQTAFLHRF